MAARPRRVVSDRGDALGKLGLAVRGLVLVDDALGGGLVQLAGGDLQRGLGGLCVAGVNGFAGLADQRLQLGLDGLVADAALLFICDLMFAMCGELLGMSRKWGR